MREQLSKLFTEALKPIWIGKEHNGRRIVDVNVKIEEGYYCCCSYGGAYDEIKISFKTLSPKGKNARWERLYLY